MKSTSKTVSGSTSTSRKSITSPVVLGPAGALRARLVGWSADGAPLVALRGEPAVTVPATTCVELTTLDPQSEPELIVVLEHGDERRPIVIGVVRPTAMPSAEVTQPPVPLSAEVRIDGKVTQVTARNELVLSCGKARITLRADGRITIRGAEVTSEAQGVNRMRGGSIELN
jgi:hypothetical protein